MSKKCPVCGNKAVKMKGAIRLYPDERMTLWECPKLKCPVIMFSVHERQRKGEA